MYSLSFKDMKRVVPAGAPMFFDRIQTIDGAENNFSGDFSLLNTLRAVVYPRLQPDEKIYFGFRSFDCDVTLLPDQEIGRNRLFLFTAEKFTSSMPDDMDSIIAEWHYRRVADMSAFVKNRLKQDVFIWQNTEENGTIILCRTLDYSLYHFLQAMITRYFPTMFNQSNPPSEQDFQIMKALTADGSSPYSEAIASAFSCIDFRESNIKFILDGFYRKGADARLADANETLSSIERDLSSIMQRYRDMMKTRDDVLNIIRGLEGAQYGSEKELIEMIVRNKEITLKGVSDDGDSISMLIHGYLDVFDPDDAQRYLDNDGSTLLSMYDVSNPVFKKRKDRRKLLRAIFSADHKIKCRTVAAVRVGRHVGICRDFRIGDGLVSDYGAIPNPHINTYNCFGQNFYVVAEMMKEERWCDAVSIAVTCVHSINVTESASTRPFLQELFATDGKCLELPSGECVSPEEALNWLNEEGE